MFVTHSIAYHNFTAFALTPLVVAMAMATSEVVVTRSTSFLSCAIRKHVFTITYFESMVVVVIT